jgi:serine O-acetyltransferase
MFENLREDWQIYEKNPFYRGLWIMVVYRFGRWRYGISSPLLRKPFSLAYKLAFAMAQIATGAEVPCEVQIGRRLRIDHTQGLVISGDARLGDDVVLRNGVTIGLRRTGHRGSPVIGNRVDVGAGAKILGEIEVGDDCSIGANAVVLVNVPADSIAVGVPASVHPKKKLVEWREKCSTVS